MPGLDKRERLKMPHIAIPKRPPQERIADFCEVTLTYSPEQAIAEASRCVECSKPPCVAACPLGNRIKDWLVLTAEGRFAEAAQVSQATSNMPEICGRICPQDRLCEDVCIVGVKHAPVAIGAIERFINDHAIAEHGLPVPSVEPSSGHRVAVVGAGPAGLACAEELVKKGHRVTVYDVHPEPGGLLRYGIPGFKLDSAVVNRRIDYLLGLGVQFVGSVRVGQDVTLNELLESGFHAVFLATGATMPKRPDLPGIGLAGVEDALPFLIRNNVDGSEVRDDLSGLHVVVLGGGDTAMDCVRTARRLGAAAVTCVYRRDEPNMPGSRREVAAAKEEGVEFRWLTAPVRFVDSGTGRLGTIECVGMALGEPDAQGRRRPIAVGGSDFLIEADLAILAFGFDGSPVAGGYGLQTTDSRTYVVDTGGMTTRPGIFAGGDVVRGPDLVVTALRDGRRAAEAIDAYLKTTYVSTRAWRTLRADYQLAHPNGKKS
ncbi:MAG TPA: NAD(P)-dependent oxidoreductase [bacterium]|nr:NAD(P)-dependent oxidoreductase [bacterium]